MQKIVNRFLEIMTIATACNQSETEALELYDVIGDVLSDVIGLDVMRDIILMSSRSMSHS